MSFNDLGLLGELLRAIEEQGYTTPTPIQAEVIPLILQGNDKAQFNSTILKVGHHGSRTSTSEEFVKSVSPLYALISDGKDNKYGHPHRDTLETLSLFGAKIFRTDVLGTIVVKSDGINPIFYFQK